MSRLKKLIAHPYHLDKTTTGHIHKSRKTHQTKLYHSDTEDMLKSCPKFPENTPYAYVANVPFVPTHNHGNFGTKETQLTSLSTLFLIEAIGPDAATSQKETPKRLGLGVGFNRMKSIDVRINRGFKTFAKTAAQNMTLPERDIGYFWDPIWRDQKGKEVDIRTVKAYYETLRLCSPAAAEAFREENEKGITPDMVPYQGIRQTLIKSQATQKLVRYFRPAASQVYIWTFDPDAQQLRRDGLGVLSHYDSLITQHHLTHELYPHILTTGFIYETEFPIINVAAKLDIAVRYQIAQKFPLAVYYPEPNTLLRVLKTKDTIEGSFEVQGGGGLEMRRMVADLVKQRKINPRNTIAYSRTGAIVTTSPDRTHKKTSEAPDFTSNKKSLQALRGIEQVHFHPNKWAKAVIQALDCKKNDMTVISLLSHLFNACDPISMAFAQERYSKKMLATILKDYDTLMTQNKADEHGLYQTKRTQLLNHFDLETVTLLCEIAENSGRAIQHTLQKELTS